MSIKYKEKRYTKWNTSEIATQEIIRENPNNIFNFSLLIIHKFPLMI